MMNEYHKPCFDGDAEHPEPCFEGTSEPKLCAHLDEGGTWATCNSGGQSGYLKAYQEVIGTEGTTELKDAGPDITLRDFFAGCALMGLMNYATLICEGWTPYAISASSYKQADAMLKARGNDEV